MVLDSTQSAIIVAMASFGTQPTDNCAMSSYIYYRKDVPTSAVFTCDDVGSTGLSAEVQVVLDARDNSANAVTKDALVLVSDSNNVCPCVADAVSESFWISPRGLPALP